MRRRHLWLGGGALALLVSFAVSAASGPIINHPVYINFASLGSEFPEDPTRVIDVAIGSWAEYGSAIYRFYTNGSTNLTGCTGSGVSHIYGAAQICGGGGTCDTLCNCIAAYETDCTNQTFAIAVNVGKFRHHLGDGVGAGTGLLLDFQSTITHESGHYLEPFPGESGDGHVVSSEVCTMRVGGNGASQGWYLCPHEMSTMDAFSGHSTAQMKTAVGIDPADPRTSWSTPASVSASTYFHFGFGTLARGRVVPPNVTRDSIFFNNATNGSQLFDYRPTGGPYAGPTTTLSNRRPTMVFNPFDNQWLLFLLEVADRPRVFVFKSPDRAAWTSLGFLREELYGATITTRSPVAAAVDPITHKVLVMVTNFENQSCAPSNWFGCQNTLNVFALDPAANYVTTAPRVTLSGYFAYGAPTLVCTNARNSSGHQCAAAVIGVDNQRSIWVFDVGISSTGVMTASGATILPGLTNMQMSASTLPAGPIGLAVTGLDGYLWMAKRTSMSAGWGGFAQMTRPVGLIASKRGPSFAASSLTPAAPYDLLVDQ